MSTNNQRSVKEILSDELGVRPERLHDRGTRKVMQDLGLIEPPPAGGVTHLDVLECMQRNGGGFVSSLAGAWMRADLDNQRRLMKAFGHTYAQYRGRLLARRGLPAVKADKAVTP